MHIASALYGRWREKTVQCHQKGSVLADGTCCLKNSSRMWLGTNNWATCLLALATTTTTTALLPLCPGLDVHIDGELANEAHSHTTIAIIYCFDERHFRCTEHSSRPGGAPLQWKHRIEAFSIPHSRQAVRRALFVSWRTQAELVYATVDQLLNGQF